MYKIQSFVDNKKARAEVVLLWNELLADPAPHNQPEESLQRLIAHADSLFFICTHQDRIIATVSGGYDGHRGWLYSLAVHSDHQRQGIARRLVICLEQALIKRGCQKLNLQVRNDNGAVMEFYRHCGFEIEDRISFGKRLY